MSRFNINKDEVEFIYSSFVVSNTEGHLRIRNTPPPSTFISGNRSGDYVSQTVHRLFRARFYRIIS